MSNSSDPIEFILFFWKGFLRCAVNGLFGVTSLELRKELMPRKLELEVSLFAYSCASCSLLLAVVSNLGYSII